MCPAETELGLLCVPLVVLVPWGRLSHCSSDPASGRCVGAHPHVLFGLHHPHTPHTVGSQNKPVRAIISVVEKGCVLGGGARSSGSARPVQFGSSHRAVWWGASARNME